MASNKRPFPVLPVLASLALLWATSCSSSSDSGIGPLTGPITGNWALHTQITAATGACAGDLGEIEDFQVSITQTGTDLTIVTPDGTFQATLDGQRIDWTGSWPDPPGTLTITASNLLVSDTAITGSLDWSWTDGTDSCTGTTRIDGTRIVPLRGQPAILFVVHDVDDRAMAATVRAALATAGVEHAEVLGEVEPGDILQVELPADRWLIGVDGGELRELELDAGELRVLTTRGLR